MLAVGIVLAGGLLVWIILASAFAGHSSAVELTSLHARWAEYSLPLQDEEEVRGNRPRPPQSVMDMADRVAETVRRGMNPDNDAWVIPENLGLWRLRSFHPNGLEVYVLCTQAQPTVPKPWFLFLHDPSTEEVSPEPVRLTEHWLQEERPIVHFADLEGDGLYEIGVHQVVRNGTVDNIDRQHFFQVETDLTLREVLVLDTDVNDVYSRKEWGSVHRRVWRANRGQLIVQIWRGNPRFGVGPVPLGELRLAQGPGGRWLVAERYSQLTSPEDQDHYESQLHASFVDRYR